MGLRNEEELRRHENFRMVYSTTLNWTFHETRKKAKYREEREKNNHKSQIHAFVLLEKVEFFKIFET